MKIYRIEKKEDVDQVLDSILTWFEENPEGMYEIIIRKPVRTSAQNNALHKYFDIVSKALNEADQPFNNLFFTRDIDIDWTPEMVKSLLWGRVMQTVLNKTHTSDLTTSEVVEIEKIVGRVVANHGVIVHFPNIEDKLNNIKEYEVI